MEGDIACDRTRQDTTLAKHVTIVVHCIGAREDMQSDNTVANQYSGFSTDSGTWHRTASYIQSMAVYTNTR